MKHVIEDAENGCENVCTDVCEGIATNTGTNTGISIATNTDTNTGISIATNTDTNTGANIGMNSGIHVGVNSAANIGSTSGRRGGRLKKGLMLLMMAAALGLTGCSSGDGSSSSGSGTNSTSESDADSASGSDAEATSGSSADTEPVEVRMAYFPNITHAQALVMKNEGSLEEALGDGYEVSWTSFTAGSSEVEALFAQEIDIGYIGPVPAINGNVKSDGDVIVIANASDAGAVLVAAADSGISSVEDLDGKTVAIPQVGNTQHLCLLNLLSQNDLSPVSSGGTVEVVAVDNSNLQNMFDQGSVDAALVPEPWGTILTSSDNVELVLDYQDIYYSGNYPVAVIVVRKDFLEEYPEVVETFLQVHIDTTDAINEDLDGAADAMIEEIYNVTGNEYEKDVILSSFSRTTFTVELNEDALLEFADVSLAEGFIDELPDDSLVDLSILEGLLDGGK
ncbi:MAG: aliphatic sulfonate ABC transporter substrate-binding protein [Lachnospiraceae bacterium]|nr:aliphatic sulfonate ABC transporter substrate-binding protein [Lachnospiraceae bacterium]